MAQTRVKVVDKGYKRALQLSKQPRLKLEIGILDKEARQQHPNEPSQGATIGQVALWNEFGTNTTPARSWLRDYVDENIDLIVRQLGADTLRVIFAGDDERTALSRRGSEYRKKMIGRIRRRIPPPNAPSTLRKKSGSVPLIDTKTFINALHWRVF